MTSLGHNIGNAFTILFEEHTPDINELSYG